VTWQAGQHQPDSLAAVVVAHDVLVHSAGMTMTLAPPLGGSLHDGPGRRRDLIGAAGMAASINDHGTVTSMTGWLRRRIG
jgi:hypothetical protein